MLRIHPRQRGDLTAVAVAGRELLGDREEVLGVGEGCVLLLPRLDESRARVLRDRLEQPVTQPFGGWLDGHQRLLGQALEQGQHVAAETGEPRYALDVVEPEPADEAASSRSSDCSSAVSSA